MRRSPNALFWSGTRHGTSWGRNEDKVMIIVGVDACTLGMTIGDV